MKNYFERVRLRARRGIAQAIGVFVFLIVLFGALYIPLNAVVLQYEALQQTLWANSVFDINALAFMESWWVWMPVIVLLIGIEYVYLQSQKRNYGE